MPTSCGGLRFVHVSCPVRLFSLCLLPDFLVFSFRLSFSLSLPLPACLPLFTALPCLALSFSGEGQVLWGTTPHHICLDFYEISFLEAPTVPTCLSLVVYRAACAFCVDARP